MRTRDFAAAAAAAVVRSAQAITWPPRGQLPSTWRSLGGRDVARDRTANASTAWRRDRVAGVVGAQFPGESRPLPEVGHHDGISVACAGRGPVGGIGGSSASRAWPAPLMPLPTGVQAGGSVRWPARRLYDQQSTERPIYPNPLMVVPDLVGEVTTLFIVIVRLPSGSCWRSCWPLQ